MKNGEELIKILLREKEERFILDNAILFTPP
jgi:hypothetical protein